MCFEGRANQILASGPDYRDQDPIVALDDFKKRVALYQSKYVPLGEYEEKNSMPYVQMIDVGRKVVSHQIRGYVVSQVANGVVAFDSDVIRGRKRFYWELKCGCFTQLHFLALFGKPTSCLEQSTLTWKSKIVFYQHKPYITCLTSTLRPDRSGSPGTGSPLTMSTAGLVEILT